uniref:SCP domain-containing protein n=1 Tax=Mesocestoides corti TaxID=53468 RepID=A0A5K3F475_MESCO
MCNAGSFDVKPAYITTCIYRPAPKELHERPYKSGVSCSECPGASTCHRKQCLKKPLPVTRAPSQHPHNRTAFGFPKQLTPGKATRRPSSSTTHSAPNQLTPGKTTKTTPLSTRLSMVGVPKHLTSRGTTKPTSSNRMLSAFKNMIISVILLHVIA